MLNLSLYDYRETYILIEGTITANGGPAAVDAAGKWLKEHNKWVIFKIFVLFTDSISKIIIPK